MESNETNYAGPSMAWPWKADQGQHDKGMKSGQTQRHSHTEKLWSGGFCVL